MIVETYLRNSDSHTRTKKRFLIIRMSIVVYQSSGKITQVTVTKPLQVHRYNTNIQKTKDITKPSNNTYNNNNKKVTK